MMDEPQQIDSSHEDQLLSALLAAYLGQNDALCPKCRYSLRGVTNGLCPECGEKIVLSIGKVDESSMPWILAMALYGLAVLFSGLGVLTVVLDITRGSLGASIAMPLAVVTAFIAAVLGFTLLTVRRERIWALSLLSQCVLVLSVLVVPISSFVVYTLVSWLS